MVEVDLRGGKEGEGGARVRVLKGFVVFEEVNLEKWVEVEGVRWVRILKGEEEWRDFLSSTEEEEVGEEMAAIVTTLVGE